MVDPFTTFLVFLLQEATRRGIDALLQHRGGGRSGPLDLTRPGEYPTLLRIKATTPVQPRPHWVLLGLRNAVGAPWPPVPILYGEQEELIVGRNQYDLAALFFTEPTSMADRPLLLATGGAHKMIVSRDSQTVAINGHHPDDAEILRLREATSGSSLGYRLPETTSERSARLLNSASLSRLARGLPPAPGTPPLGSILAGGSPPIPRYGPGAPGLYRRGLRRRPPPDWLLRQGSPGPFPTPLLSGLAPPARPALPPAHGPASKPPTPPSKAPPSTPAAPAAPSTPSPTATPPLGRFDTVCGARTRKGQRCKLSARSSQGGVCPMHLDIVAAGGTVLWSESGEPIHLRSRGE